MLLAREFVAYLSRQVVGKLTPTFVETPNPQVLIEITNNLLLEELEMEDRLNDEVRDILEQYSDYMRRESVSYQEMFRKIKNTLIAQRKVIRASGRDTGDGMKLSRDKITDISHKLIASLRKAKQVRFRKDQNEVRLEVVRLVSGILQTEERSDKAARDKIRTLKRSVPEGSEEWDLLHRRYYAEELRKLGIDTGASA
ncbi:MAG: DUF507 family protein [Bryobacteraceae bacterium]